MYNNPNKAVPTPYGTGYPSPGYGQPTAQSVTPMIPAGAMITAAGQQVPTPAAPVTPGQLPMEQSFIENILRLNLGKIATLYMTYENNSQWNAKIFKGRIEAAGRDHIIVSDPKTGMRFLLLMVNLDYITFDEPLQYTYPYGSAPLPGR
ncbi:spore coat protein GerQ [Paenibacillus ehimensis]|uniref:Spore coat protein GerQ n=1 Tax=Paenibacillus ehimensis TaxID=79264 RepID=A0ABT8V256_9BACL|nr:spore coat protein GerQ [Paenibacillus ehimensis]MDO3675488.1 spore coat protein GerQ [Paenibacillus ehimensis]MEC0209488.1 spore coat protein GerQ [Paenibacillus ehimensis]